MRIGIFTNVLAHQLTGIGWHVRHLLDHLARIDRDNDYFLFYRAPWPGRHDPHFCPEAANFHNVPIATPDLFYRRYFRVFDQTLLPRAIARRHIDVFHGPNHYLPARRRIPQIVTYHDLAAAKLDFNGSQAKRAALQAIRRTLDRADRVITVSHSTMRDVGNCGYAKDCIEVIYQGANFDDVRPPPAALIDQMRKQFGLIGRYILFVGTLGPRKNVSLLLRAYASLRRRIKDCPSLVLAGGHESAELDRLHALLGSLNLADNVTFTDYLDGEQMRGLYGGASLFVLPSLYEGFGMPVLEAMAYGVPVIATRAGALAEVVGDAGLLVDVDDESAMAAAMERVLSHDAQARDLIERGFQRAGRFSWEQCAKQTRSLYERVVRDAS